ncbi:MAG TPA: HAD family hydrolase [Acidimicrobiia bacterium]|nr:HAD family hydrolase [Acidimicrobiia bacterium]
MIAAVAFDIGETLINETRIWSRWADRLGVPRLSFIGVLGGVAAQGRPHREVFEFFRPGFDLQGELERWRADDPDGLKSGFDAVDLYPDVRPTFTRLQKMGKRVVIAGNQPVEARAALEAMDLGADRILISADLGSEKPSPNFFDKVGEAVGLQAGNILYVGDRVDNDVLPAKASGMHAVLIRRGPWGYLQAEWPQAAEADSIIDSLSEIPDLVI